MEAQPTLLDTVRRHGSARVVDSDTKHPVGRCHLLSASVPTDSLCSLSTLFNHGFIICADVRRITLNKTL